MAEDNEDFLDEELLDQNSIDNLDIDEENKGLYEHLNITVDKSQEPLRIDKFLLIFRQNSSRNKISQTCRAGNVIVNGVAVKQNYRVKPGIRFRCFWRTLHGKMLSFRKIFPSILYTKMTILSL